MDGADWPFEDPPNVAVITTREVMHGGAWIAFVSHDEDDGGWQFHGPDEADVESAMVVGLGRIIEMDPTIAQLADLPVGWQAWRASQAASWQRAPL
jgi:hypothetical protein